MARPRTKPDARPRGRLHFLRSDNRPSAGDPPATAFLRLGVSLLIAVAATGCGPAPSEPAAPSPTSVPAAAPASNAAPASAQAQASTEASDRYRKLVGRWQRTDAEYIVEVRAVEAVTGRAEAAYLNPNPIHVSQAQASEEGGKVKLFVELQDVGYPGSNYRLTYFPATDQLYGVYYQAAIGQSFDVEFERVR